MTLIELYTMLQDYCLYDDFYIIIASKKGTIH